jgi:hypothetical protein
VVNEALAFGLPILASSQIGATDVLTRNLLNGFVVELGSVKGIAHAMLELAGNEERWNDLAANRAAVRGWRIRSAFADAVELMMFPGTSLRRATWANSRRIAPDPVPCLNPLGHDIVIHKKPAVSGGFFCNAGPLSARQFAHAHQASSTARAA